MEKSELNANRQWVRIFCSFLIYSPDPKQTINFGSGYRKYRHCVSVVTIFYDNVGAIYFSDILNPKNQLWGKDCHFFIREKNPVNNHSAKFKELRYRVADIVSSKSVPCIIEYSMSDNKALRWADFNKKNNDISGFYSAIKFSAQAREIIAAYQDILNMFDKEHKLLTNILIGFSGSELIEIRYEFETDPDFEVLLKDFLKKHPDIRVLSVTSSKKCTDQTVLVSGSGTHKFKTKKISYERCWDNDYNHLSSKFNLWETRNFMSRIFTSKRIPGIPF